MNVCCKIAIAEIEPIDAAVDRETFQQVEGLAAKSPAFFRIDNVRRVCT